MIKTDRKTQIVEMAVEHIQKSGFDSFSYNDLSQQLGIAKASIHHHFPKKEDLGLAICERLHQWTKYMETQVNAAGLSSLDKLNVFFNSALSLLEGENKLLCPISSLQAESNVLPESMRNEVKQIGQQEHQIITQILQTGLEKGDIDFKGTAEAQAAYILSAIKGGIQYGRFEGQSFLKDLIEQIKRNLVN